MIPVANTGAAPEDTPNQIRPAVKTDIITPLYIDCHKVIPVPSKILAVSKTQPRFFFAGTTGGSSGGNGTAVVVVDSYWRVVGIVIYCFFQVVCRHNSLLY
jgi:hypothetical protein